MTVAARDIVRSPLLDGVPGLVHGFTTRALGSMAGSVYSAEEQSRNREALARTIGMPIVKTRLVHGEDVALVEGGRATRLRDGVTADASDHTPLEADALITRGRGFVLAVAVADCVPVLVVTRDGWIGIGHAGWAGTSLRIATHLHSALETVGADLGERRAVIGPSIGPCCYRIDPAHAAVVRERLVREADRVLLPDGEHHRFDLWLANLLELRRWGERHAAVDSMDLCTRDHVAAFFSHRGENGRAGRGLAFIGWRS